MEGLARVFPEFASTTAILPPSHTAKSRRLAGSIAKPEGDSQLVSGHVAVIFLAAASKRTISFLLSMLAKTVPLPSATGNSGLPSRGMVATTLRSAVSITDALLLRPLKAQTVLVTGSKTIPSGFVPAGIEATAANEARS